MASFDISVGDKTYKMEYTYDSIRKFEDNEGKLTDMREKIYTTTDKLFYVGLMKYHPNMSYAESAEIAKSAVQEFGVDEVYSALSEKFMMVFSQAGSGKTTGKTFLISKAAKS